MILFGRYYLIFFGARLKQTFKSLSTAKNFIRVIANRQSIFLVKSVGFKAVI